MVKRGHGPFYRVNGRASKVARRPLGPRVPVRNLVRLAAGAAVKRAISSTTTQTEKKTSKRAGYKTGAGYRGHFTRRRFNFKRGSPATKSENYYSRYGVTDTTEVSGTISDDQCVYIGHSSFSPVRMFEAAMQSMYRKLYTIAIGYDVCSASDVVPYKDGQSDGNTIHLSWRDEDGVMSSMYQSIGLGASIAQLGQMSFSITGAIRNMAILRRTPQRIWVVDNSTNLQRASLDLTRLKFDYMFKSEMKIQNVTIPTTTDNEMDDVNNVPLVGRTYEFSGWSPMMNGLAAPNGTKLALVNDLQGVTLVRGMEMGVDGMLEPPPSSVFTNCVKSQKVRVQPGTIKSDWLRGGGTLTLNKLLLAMDFKITPPAQGNRNSQVRIGKHAMISLERVIHINGTLPIKCYYEVNHFCGVVAKPGISHGIVGTFFSTTLNNVQP